MSQRGPERQTPGDRTQKAQAEAALKGKGPQGPEPDPELQADLDRLQKCKRTIAGIKSLQAVCTFQPGEEGLAKGLADLQEEAELFHGRAPLSPSSG